MTTGITSFFITSKNFEVDPVCLRDVADHLLGNRDKRTAIR